MQDRIDRVSDEFCQDHALDALVGFEISVVLQAVRAGNADSKTRAILFRPAIEPILLLHGEKVWRPEFNQIDALAMACSLCGRELTFRSERCFGEALNGKVEFEPLDRVRSWLPEVKGIIQESAMGLAASAAVFARTITAHPMSDGNGRLARALSHSLLLREKARSVAPIALAPAFYAKRNELSLAFVDLCSTGDWSGYYKVFLQILDLALSRSVASREVFAGGALRRT